ncbi:MAG TPA: glycosyltransferase 87 family protein [Gaiellaceae bacterium]|nr:glycosyltransferase 87 family protein [Gaiellaceae bacterium]
MSLLLIGSALATAVLLALGARLSSLVSTLLVTYLAFTANLGLTTIALSPIQAVTRAGLGVAEALLLVSALAFWWVRGRPAPPLTLARVAVREVVSDLPTAAFLVFVLVLLGYELVLGLTVPPNNTDAIAYHLARAAAWAQHGGIYWIPNVPTVRMNAFQPFAEQQLLFLLVAVRGGRLAALPQFLAELAILVAVYGSARRLGFAARPAACAAFLVATFSLFALEATTAQNDIVAASFPAVAVCLLLGPGRIEPLLGGMAAGMGLGVKLTTGLVLPILVWLAVRRGRWSFAAAVAGGVVGFALLGMWGYVLNYAETGHLLGAGTGVLEDRASPSYPGSVMNALYLLYGLMDLSVLSNNLIGWLAVAGLLAGVGVAAWTRRSESAARAARNGLLVALPFFAPILVLAGAALIADVTGWLGFPLRGPNGALGPLNASLGLTYTRVSSSDYSALGPLAVAAVIVASAIAVVAYLRGRADSRHLVLACAAPCFLVLISATTSWTSFLIRFFTVAAVVAAPLFAWLFPGRAATVAFAVVACLTVSLTVADDPAKPLSSPYGYGRPWNLSPELALAGNSRGAEGEAVAGLDRTVTSGCLGAIVGESDPTYYLYGSHLQRHVIFLPEGNPVTPAKDDGLTAVVVSTDFAHSSGQFVLDGWKVRPIGGVWLLATRKVPPGTACRP